MYIGGQFARVGTPTGSFAPVDANTGAALPHPIVNGTVKAQLADGTGGWFIAGDFTHIDGRAHQALAHVRADGTLDPAFTPPPRLLSVDALALDGATLYLAGSVRTSATQTQPYLVMALDVSTGSTEKWSAYINGVVHALAAGAKALFLAGSFGTRPSPLAALSKATGAALAWNPGVGLSSGTASIEALIASGNTVFVAGTFDTIAGVTRTSLAALDAGTAAALPWNPQLGGRSGFPPTLHCMTLDGPSIYIGGEFASVSGQARLCAAAVDTADAHLLPWDAGLAAPVNSGNPPSVTAIAVNANTVFVAGFFAVPGTATRVSAAALDKATSHVRNWLDVGPAVAVRQMTAIGTQVAICGNFKLLAGTRRNNIAAIDVATGQVTGWNPDSLSTDGDVNTGVVNRLLAVGNTVYVAGQIERIGGADRHALAALDAGSGQALPWDPQIVGHVTAIAATDTRLYVAGDTLTSAGGQARTLFAAFDLSTGQVSGWGPRSITAGSITQLLATASAVYAAGDFGTNSGQPRSCLAAFDPNTGALLPWSADVSSQSTPSVSGLSLLGNALYVVGNFERVAGGSRPGIAAVDARSGALLSWPQSIAIINPRAIAAAGDRVYVATSQGGGNPPARAILVFSISTGMLLDDQYILEGYASSLAIGTSDLYAGGNFTGDTNVLALGVTVFPLQ